MMTASRPSSAPMTGEPSSTFSASTRRGCAPAGAACWPVAAISPRRWCAAAPGLGRVARLRDDFQARAAKTFNPDRRTASHEFYVAMERRKAAHALVGEQEVRVTEVEAAARGSRGGGRGPWPGRKHRDRGRPCRRPRACARPGGRGTSRPRRPIGRPRGAGRCAVHAGRLRRPGARSAGGDREGEGGRRHGRPANTPPPRRALQRHRAR